MSSSSGAQNYKNIRSLTRKGWKTDSSHLYSRVFGKIIDLIGSRRCFRGCYCRGDFGVTLYLDEDQLRRLLRIENLIPAMKEALIVFLRKRPYSQYELKSK